MVEFVVGDGPKRLKAVVVDGIVLSSSMYHSATAPFALNITAQDDVALLATQWLSDLPSTCGDLTLKLWDWSGPTDIAIDVSFTLDNQLDTGLPQGRLTPPLLRVHLELNLAVWKRPWSVGEFVLALKSAADSGAFPGIVWHENHNYWAPHYMGLEVRSYSTDASIGELMAIYGNQVADVVSAAERNLVSRIQEGTLVASFDFPEAVRVPCEQYLLYFAQFLKDLGMEAQADIHHEAGRVLFSVTPADGKEALAKLREALECYLQLPDATKGAPLTTFMEDPRAQALLGNIRHLESQLLFQQSALQMREIMIGQLTQQNAALMSRVMETSLKALEGGSPAPPEKEDVVPGLAIKKYDGKWFEADLPRWFRDFKRLMFVQDEKK